MQRYRSGHNGADSKSVCANAHEGSNPSLCARKETPFVYQTNGVSFQLNPPFRMGEIISDDEIPYGDEIRLDGGWVDLISSASADFIRASLGFHRVCAISLKFMI